MSVPTKYGSPARRRLMPLAATAFAVLSLLGSAGLAQSMFGDTATTSGPKPKLKRVERPKLSSFEYRLSWGLQSVESGDRLPSPLFRCEATPVSIIATVTPAPVMPRA